ncbi:MAG: trigger factor [Ruminococcaceae bacterium]|nr:trigger factor [Oscillospiraceae bacterium]
MSTVEKAEKKFVEFEFSVSGEEFKAAIEKAYRQNVGKITIPGFRRGKAPRNIIEKYYGSEIFFEDAVNIVLPDAYDKAIDEQNIEAVAQPEIDVKDISKENGVVFTAKVVVKPDFELGQYKGVEISKVTYRTTEKEIKGEIEKIRERNARMVNVEDRAAKLEDTVNIDFEGFTDGVAFDGGKGESFDLKLGSGQFIPGFEEQLVGANVGDDVEVNVTFPEEYHAEDLKGKPAVFKVKVNAIKAQELPELDDEFAKDVSEFDTFEEFKADLSKKLKEKNKEKAKKEMEDAAIEKVCENTEIAIPEEMFETAVNNQLRDFAMQLQYQGITIEQYAQYTGVTLDAMKDQIRPGAEKQVKTSLVLEKIAKVEGIKVTDKDVEKELEKMAEQSGMSVDDVKKYVDIEGIKDSKLIEKTVEFIVKNAEVK